MSFSAGWAKARCSAPLLLLPALAWTFAFFLLPLALMCWRSIASEGFSLEPYACSSPRLSTPR